jgi:hypothetical protein
MFCTVPGIVQNPVEVVLVRRHVRRVPVKDLAQQVHARRSREALPKGRLDVLCAVDSEAVAMCPACQTRVRIA